MSEQLSRVMVVMPHPDDAEFGAAGTIASWGKDGKEVTYVVCTNGDKGSSDPEMTSERLAEIRRKEQTDAANMLGVKDIVFLDYPDGWLEDTPEFRGKLVRLIRKYRPDIVMTTDPYRKYMWHRDHRITGVVTLDAIFPYSRDRLSYPEHIAEGLQPHHVKEIYLWGSEDQNIYVDITDTFDTKIAALACHTSQVGSRIENLKQRMRERAESTGKSQGFPLAEGFHHIVIPY
jgi:LmbE family N-acetylglucosaminyl deacetylase